MPAQLNPSTKFEWHERIVIYLHGPDLHELCALSYVGSKLGSIEVSIRDFMLELNQSSRPAASIHTHNIAEI